MQRKRSITFILLSRKRVLDSPIQQTTTLWTTVTTLALLLSIVRINAKHESPTMNNPGSIYTCGDDNEDNESITNLQATTPATGVVNGGEAAISVFVQQLETSNIKPIDESLVDDHDPEPEELLSWTKPKDFQPPTSPPPHTSTPPEWMPHEKLLVRDSKHTKGPNKTFRLIDHKLTCPDGREKKEFHWHSAWEGMKPKTNPCTKIIYSNLSLLEDGSLVWNKQDDERHLYRNEDFCVSRCVMSFYPARYKEPSEVTFKVCTPDYLSFRKCCNHYQVIDEFTKACISASTPWRPIFYNSSSEQKEDTDKVASNMPIIFGFPQCPKKYMINASPQNNFKLLVTGTLVQNDGVRRTFINSKEFCIDGIYYKSTKDNTESHGVKQSVKYSRSEWDQVVIACKPREVDEFRIPAFATLNHISALFLLITDIVYILLWRHQNIHGWFQFAYTTSLFCTFNCFAVVQRWSDDLKDISPRLCKVMGCVAHLTYLSAFFWLTSMNFDLWWRFSRPLRSTQMRSQETKWKRFLGFAAFSIVVPLMISGIGIFLDNIYDDYLLEPPFIVPGFGKEKCYFEKKRSQIPYLYGPAGILLLIDLIFFTSTVLHLRKIHAHTELARTQSTMEDKTGLLVIAKLFIVMGVLWVFELASWIAHILLPENEEIINWVFLPADILNSLQGVAIFIIFVCKPNVGNQLLAIFRRDDSISNNNKSWNKQTHLPSVTVQQSGKEIDYVEIR